MFSKRKISPEGSTSTMLGGCKFKRSCVEILALSLQNKRFENKSKDRNSLKNLDNVIFSGFLSGMYNATFCLIWFSFNTFGSLFQNKKSSHCHQ